MTVADLVLLVVGAYLGQGLIFGVPFVVRGAGAIDPAAVRAGWGFRVLILPGAVAFWPLLLSRVVGAARVREKQP